MQLSIKNIIWRVVLFLGALLLLLDLFAVFAVSAGRNIGTYTGMFLCLLAMGYALLQPKVHKVISGLWKKGGARRAGLIVVTVFAVLIALAALTETIFMVAYSHKKAPASEKPPVVVVLGCQVLNGSPSMLLSERIDTAYDYLCDHPECSCIVSGGQGSDEAMSEAKCMFDELTKKGIAPERIYMEDRSTTTRENLQFSKEIMEREDLGDTIILVTNSWHELRAQMIAESLGIPCGAEGAGTPLWLLPCNYFRELYAILYQIVF